MCDVEKVQARKLELSNFLACYEKPSLEEGDQRCRKCVHDPTFILFKKPCTALQYGYFFRKWDVVRQPR